MLKNLNFPILKNQKEIAMKLLTRIDINFDLLQDLASTGNLKQRSLQNELIASFSKITISVFFH